MFFELCDAGHNLNLMRFRGKPVANPSADAILLRLSDPIMRAAVQAFTCAGVPFVVPSAAVFERCFDKYEAYRITDAGGIECPKTALGSDPDAVAFPLVLKPRLGSDSIGIKLWKKAPLPARLRNDGYVVQRQVRGAELTVAVFRDRAGMPLRIFVPEGMPYSVTRKYLWRPAPAAVTDNSLAERVRSSALTLAGLLGVDWGARVDLIHDAVSDRLYFLECDVAPLVGAGSAFAASFRAAGVDRAEQLRMLVSEIPSSVSSMEMRLTIGKSKPGTYP